MSGPSPFEAALGVLNAAAPAAKTAAAANALAILEREGLRPGASKLAPPQRPARPAAPPLAPPAEAPRRRLGTAQGRAALLHAVAHIEFNAIDLAFDMAVRFVSDIDEAGLDSAQFFADWVRIGAEEARHFLLVEQRLSAYGVRYGDLSAHDGLWEAAEKTAEDVTARLVVAPMILEARGLDVTPGMIERLKGAGDHESAEALGVIYDDEIGHVACGKRWFHGICKARGEDPAQIFHNRREHYFAGALKPPFNHKARAAAGLERAWYEPD